MAGLFYNIIFLYRINSKDVILSLLPIDLSSNTMELLGYSYFHKITIIAHGYHDDIVMLSLHPRIQKRVLCCPGPNADKKLKENGTTQQTKTTNGR